MRLSKALTLLLAVSMSALAQADFDPEKDIAVAFNKGVVTLTAPKGTHLKQSFMKVELHSKDGRIHVGTMTHPDAKDEAGDAIWHGSVKIPITGEGLKDPVELEVTYQACTEGEGGICFPPTTRTLTVKAAEVPAAQGRSAQSKTKR